MREYSASESRVAVPDIDRVLKSNYLALFKLLVLRILVTAALIAIPVIVIRSGGPNTFFTVLPVIPGVFIFLLTGYRLLYGVRIGQCALVLHHYPLEFRDLVDKKQKEWGVQGTIYTLRVSVRGQQGEPTMWAMNAAGVRRWPQGADEGVWFAGDSAFGGVMVVPGSNAMMLMNPSDWGKLARKREQADSGRAEQAKLAKIDKSNWKEPKFWRGG